VRIGTFWSSNVKQVTQRLRDGKIDLREVPVPELHPDGVLVGLRASLLSSGTERSKVEAGRQSLIAKARSRPDQVRQVIEKTQRDGVREAVHAVRTRLDQPAPLGYSSAGVVAKVGERVRGVAPGDRVACGGEEAAHAEMILVPGNLCVPLPEGIDYEQGAFATIGSVALHGVRQADVRLGERVAVIGLGLVGQLAGELLRAAGCRVVGVDLSESLVKQSLDRRAVDVAYQRGALHLDALPADATDMDAVIVAATTSSSDPVELGAAMCRDRGRVVVIGAVGMNVPRPPFYGKELDLRLSRSYGPGRYDTEYEQRGLDYPIGYVRWTEQRNMRAFLELVAAGRVDVTSMISRRVPIARAPEAYSELVDGDSSTLGIVLEYDNEIGEAPPPPAPVSQRRPGTLALGVIGAGSFAQRILIPAFASAGFELTSVASQAGLSASAAAERFGFASLRTPSELLAADDVSVVAVATRHSTHAQFARGALDAGKAVFVEKPPCLSTDELTALRESLAASGSVLAVGFNRRYAPLVGTLRERTRSRTGPAEVVIRVSAGLLAPDHWLNDPADGGGRLLGEGCHFVDLACWLVGALPDAVTCSLHPDPGAPLATAQRFNIGLTFPDGSLATIAYLCSGHPRLPKEYVEFHADGVSATIDDFRRMSIHDRRRPERLGGRAQDKGHGAQIVRLARVLRGQEGPEPLHPLDTMEVTLAAAEAAREGSTVRLR
jgi:predicted dehydrogenase